MAAPWRLGLLARTSTCKWIFTGTSRFSSVGSGSSLQHVNVKPQSQLFLPWHLQVRHGTFFTHYTADELWKGVVGVSNAGKKRGRGKRVGRKKITDLNKGQVLGTGSSNMVWPGLNAPIIKGREVMQRKQLPANPDREKELVRIRDEMAKIRYNSLPPLQRGYSGNRYPGQSVGKPDRVADYEFDDFETKCVEFKLVTNMTGTLGRKMRFTAFVVTGNRNGLAGCGLGKSLNGKAAIRMAKNRAAQNLQFIERFNDHTVYHNMYNKYHRTKIFIHKREEGHGLVCHRVLKTISELIGIKDLHCKVEGSTKNTKALTYGFFEALRNQETHQALADRMKLNVVELRPERENLPVVVAAPSDKKVAEKELMDEEEDLEMDFQRIYYDGKVEYKRPPKRRVFDKLRSYRMYKARKHMQRNQYDCHLKRVAGLS